MKTLKEIQNRLNLIQEKVANLSYDLDEAQTIRSENVINWMCNECSGIEGSNINNGILTFKI